MTRQLVFISHATPEENLFVRWLGARLELLGFSVWHDLDRLKGGDIFWDKIERAIREDTFRFLAVVSKTSVVKPGVQDEWQLAKLIETDIPGFVIPIRIDDISYKSFPIGIGRKNAIDFSTSWHKGLTSLTDTLTEASTPRNLNTDPQATRQWLDNRRELKILRTNTSELLDSNWIEIKSLPPALAQARILGNEREIKVTPEYRRIPWFEHEDRIYGFAKSADLVSLMAKSVMLKETLNEIHVPTFIVSGSSMGDRLVKEFEARKRVSNLVRQAWELALEAKGFGSYEQSGRRRVFFVTPELTGGRGKQISFIDVDGRHRRKSLNGRSEKRKVNWSYAVGMLPSLEAPLRIEIRATIVFTDDDGKPIDSASRAHRLRMSFCRSWWNDRWRGFLRAFLGLLANGQPEIRLPVGSDRFILLNATPIIFSAPVGLSDLAPGIDSDPIVELDDDSTLDDEVEDAEVDL